MAPKKSRFRPPIFPKADGSGFVRAVGGGAAGEAHRSTQLMQRGREGYPGAESARGPLQRVPECIDKKNDPIVELTLKVTADSSLPSNEARFSPAFFRSLGVLSGAVVRIAAAQTVAYAEAFLHSSCHSRVMHLADETAASLDGKEAVVSLVTDTIMPLSRVIVEITCDSSDLQMVPVEIPVLQVRSVFRRQYQRRLVFTGMRAVVRVATQAFFVEVTRCFVPGDNGEQSVGFGIAADGATIVQGAEAPCASPGVVSTGDAEIAEDAIGHLLVIGEPGTGKSRRVFQEGQGDATQRGRHVETVLVETLSQGELCDVSTATVLREIFARARSSTPSTVLIDDLHLIAGRGMASSWSTGSPWATALVAVSLAAELDLIQRQSLNVRVVAAAPSLEALDESLPARLGQRVTLLSPASVDERRSCLCKCLDEQKALGSVSAEVIDAIARDAHGFTQRDLARLVETAVVEGFKLTGTATVSDTALRDAARSVRPSALRQFEVSIPQVSWDDIGGSDVAKKTLQECVGWCLGKQRWIFSRYKLSPPKGVLLYGPPGCSKTMLAKALANESKMNFISVKGPEVFSKWVGDSEKAVREIFTRARAVAPCVVFIDELDGMCGHRGRGGVSDRVISQFLTELDGLPASLDNNAESLVFVAATNRPDNIDTAVLRPGRIDRKVYVGLPDLAERRAIVGIQFRRVPIAPDLDADYIATRTEGYSGAEVVAVVKEAAFLRVTANPTAAHITREDIDAALQKVRPRISPKDVEWYKHWARGESIFHSA